jgi:hypothetical protein
MNPITDTTFQEDIASIRRRIVIAEADRNGWGMAGLQEDYLEACSTVERLEVELDERVARQAREARAIPEGRDE